MPFPFKQGLASKLKAELEAAREAKKNAPAEPTGQGHGSKDEGDDFVTLTRTDRSGNARPVPDGEFPAESGGRRRKRKQKVTTCYFFNIFLALAVSILHGNNVQGLLLK